MQFAFDGVPYEIDLCEDHRAAFGRAVGPFADRARKLPRGGRPASPKTKRTAFDRDVDKMTRELAREAGEQVSDHGRLPVRFVEKYDDEAREAVKAQRARRRQR